MSLSRAPPRGLRLIKWLLAIPDLLLIVGLIVAEPAPISVDKQRLVRRLPAHRRLLGQLNLLVVVAGFFLLITRQHPRGLFDLLVGVKGLLYRVLTYLAVGHELPTVSS